MLGKIFHTPIEPILSPAAAITASQHTSNVRDWGPSFWHSLLWICPSGHACPDPSTRHMMVSAPSLHPRYLIQSKKAVQRIHRLSVSNDEHNHCKLEIEHNLIDKHTFGRSHCLPLDRCPSCRIGILSPLGRAVGMPALPGMYISLFY